MRIRPLVFALLLLAPALPARSELVVDFEDLTLPPDSFHNGNPGNLLPGQTHDGSFTSRGATFHNTFGIDQKFGFEYWSGWAYSNRGDTTTAGFGNQYSSFAGGGSGGGGIFGVAFAGGGDAYINLPDVGFAPDAMSARITNTTYAALSMRDGDSFSEPFGGSGGDRPDFFLLTITGYAGADATGAAVGSVPFYLADYRSADRSRDYIVGDWELVDLTALLGARSLGFELTADAAHDSMFGLTIPAYFALDNLTIAAVPEPSAAALLALGALGLLAARRRTR